METAERSATAGLSASESEVPANREPDGSIGAPEVHHAPMIGPLSLDWPCFPRSSGSFTFDDLVALGRRDARLVQASTDSGASWAEPACDRFLRNFWLGYQVPQSLSCDRTMVSGANDGVYLELTVDLLAGKRDLQVSVESRFWKFYLPTSLQILQQRKRRMTLAEASRPDRLGEGWSLQITATDRPGTPTFFLAREPAESEPKLTPTKREELEDACKAQATAYIQIEKARLLVESAGVAIIALQPGSPDVSKVNMPYNAGNFLRNVQEEIASCDSLRKVPLVTLAKVFSIRMTQNDIFVLERLGLLVSEDFSTEVTLTKMRGASTGTHIIKARKHKWAAISTMEDLAHVVDGLVLCVKRFHHESVCSHQEITEL